jgi:glycosyltransferase involved in cell wall biosynthesis
MIEVEKIPAQKLRFIPSGISTPAAPSGADVRSELGIAEDAPLVGVVAGLRAPKALDIFIRAVDELRRKHAGLRALIVGNRDRSGEEKRLLDLTRELSLDDTLIFTGLRSDVADALAAMDVAVLSSDHEGSPLSVMEYMEAARPVVATNVGGIPDLVVDGVTGILVPPRDPAALAAAISGLLDDPDLRRRFGEAGRARRRSEFDISNTVRRVEDLYEELYALKRPD